MSVEAEKDNTQNENLKPKDPPKLIAIEGLISAGKSTFCKTLDKKTIQGKKVICSFETINVKLLEKFCENQKKYAFAMQLNTMTRRMQQAELLRYKYNNTNHTVILDRSMDGDSVFATKHFLSGNMTETEMQIYSDETKWNNLAEMLKSKHISAIVYLHSTPQICRRNVQKRDDVDKNYKEDYLNELDDLYTAGNYNLLLGKQIPIYYLDWRNFGNPVETYNSILENIETGGKSGKKPSQISWYDKKTFDCDKGPKVIIDYEDQTISEESIKQNKQDQENCKTLEKPIVLEEIPEHSLPGLEKKYRKRLSQYTKNLVASALNEGKHVYFRYYGKTRPITLIDYFDENPRMISEKFPEKNK